MSPTQRPLAPLPRRRFPADQKPVKALVADLRGNIIELDGYGAVGMAGSKYTLLTQTETIAMPPGGELMFLPERAPVLFNLKRKAMETVHTHPQRGEPVFPVAVFNSPGYVNTYMCAYAERAGAGPLPLFSYGAVGWRREGFRSAALQVDAERRQDLRLMPMGKVHAGVAVLRKQMPANRLRAHLEKCALTYGCPAAKNFFLGRYEAPLPTARKCNAGCLGCISLQKSKTGIRSPQDRIEFEPTPGEIAEIALTHIQRVERAVVSFGQGCEGDPLLAADVIAPAIEKIRQATPQGTINMNTNGSRPEILTDLFDAGLDSVRISLNSVQPECYKAYFQPAGYDFAHVVKSIDLSLAKGKFVSINYLNCPGVTDGQNEAEALLEFLSRHPVHLIQWRNLNFDPLRYQQAMGAATELGDPMGLPALLGKVRRRFPDIKFGYFNPPKEKF